MGIKGGGEGGGGGGGGELGYVPPPQIMKFFHCHITIVYKMQ